VPLFPNGVVSICADDSYASQLSALEPLLTARGFRATLNLISGAVDLADSGASALYLKTTDVQWLQNVRGWEIGSHCHAQATHGAIATMSADEIRADLLAQQAWLTDRGLKGGRTYAYPNGAFNGVVRAGIHRLVDSARTINRSTQWADPLPPRDLMRLPAASGVAGSSGFTPTSQQVTDLKAAKGWGIWVLHDVQPTSSTANVAATPALTTALDLLVSASVPVLPVGEVVAAVRSVTG
jgi:peptidoglycan/xylan/chitin deacetylase (PgdA/CDA1 family)